MPWWEVLAAQSCPTLQSHGLQSTRLLCPWHFPGNDTGVVCHFLLQGTIPTYGSNSGLLHHRQIIYQLSQQGGPTLEEGMAAHSSLLAWRIPWTEGSGGLQSIGSQEESDMTEMA